MTREELQKKFKLWLEVKEKAILISRKYNKELKAYKLTLQAIGYIELSMLLEIINEKEFYLLLENFNKYRIELEKILGV